MPEYQRITGYQSEVSDNELVNRLGNADEEAFSLIYQKHWEDLFVSAARTLRDEEAAADVVQDVFVALWNRRNELNITGDLAAYLHTSVRYKCINYIEKNITRKDYLTRLAETIETYHTESITENLQLKELQETLHEVVNQMPPRMQEVYRLSRDEYLSHKEIAQMLNISSETVKKHIQHAMDFIKASMMSQTVAITFIFYRIFL